MLSTTNDLSKVSRLCARHTEGSCVHHTQTPITMTLSLNYILNLYSKRMYKWHVMLYKLKFLQMQ